MLAARFLRAVAPRATAASRRLSCAAAATNMGKIVHYDSTTCPYAQRSWITLVEKGLDFDIRKVDLANKDPEFVSVYHSINPDQEAAAKVPILIDSDGTKLIESGIIVDYLNSKYPQPPLLPADPAAAAKARLFAETFSSNWNWFAFFTTETKEQVAEATEKLVTGLKVLDAFLRLHGHEEGGSYLLGGTYSVAEVFATGFVQRAIVVLPVYRGVDVRALLKEHKLDRLERWVDAVLARPSAQQTKPADEVMVQSLQKFLVPFKE